MKKISIYMFAMVAIAVFSSLRQGLQSKSNGNIIGFAGAPLPGGGSESTCTNCHGGTLNSGPSSLSISVQGNPSGFVPGQTYSVTATLVNSNVAQAGFSLTCLDPQLAMCGTFANGTGTRIVTDAQSGRFYINHSGTSLKTWTFSWTAPSQNLPDSVTFFAASREASPNNIYSGKKVFRNQSITALSGAVSSIALLPYPNPASQQIRFSKGPVSYTIRNLSGISVKEGLAEAGESVQLSGLPSGSYIWQAKTADEKNSGSLLIP
jgi:hypothetical protein